ncbi:MAG: hypothetical protein ACI4KB_08900 [Oscillospiraceae bacterium]
MTKDNLYTAIGKINDRYLKDVLKEESESFQNTHSYDLSVDCERTIVMDVVRKKKKRKNVFIIAAVLMLTAAAAAAVMAGIRNNNEEPDQDIAVKYFTQKEIELPEHLLKAENGFTTDSALYLQCFYEAERINSVFSILEENGSMNDLILNTEIYYLSDLMVSKDRIYTAERDKKGSMKIKVYDKSTGLVSAEKSPGNINLTGMHLNQNQELELFTEEYREDGILHTLHSRISTDTLEEKSVSDISEFIDSSLSVNHSAVVTDYGYYIISEKINSGEITAVYRFDNDDSLVYTYDDFGFTDKTVVSAFAMKNGNLCFASTDDYYSFDIDETDMLSGETVSYYHLTSDEKITSFKNITTEKYDFIYETEGGYYGFVADCELSESVYEKNKSGKTLEAAGPDNELIFFSQSDSTGYYVQILNEDGSLSESKYPLFSDDEITDLPRSSVCVSDNGTFYCIAVNEDEEMYHIVQTSTDGTTEKTEIEIPENFKGLRFGLVDPLIYLNGNFYTIVYYEDSNRICELSCEGKILSLSGEDDDVSYISDIVKTNDNRILVGYFEKGNISCIMNTSYYEPGKKVSEGKADLPPSIKLYSGFDDYIYLYSNLDGIYGYTVENSAVEIINWLDADWYGFNPESDINNVFFDRGGAVYNNLNGLVKYEPSDVSEEKTIISVAVDSDDITFKDAIVDFNRNNEDYRIKLINYKNFSGSSENGMLSHDTLTADIAAGKIPDLIITDNNGELQKYQAMGILDDLRPYIDRDSEISYEDYFANVFDSFSDGDKMYQLCVNFGISGIAGSKTVLGEERYWTRDEFLDFAEGKKDVFFNLSTDSLKDELISCSDFINFSNYTCTIDTLSFAGLLNFIKDQGLTEQEIAERYKENTDSCYARRFVDGSCLAENIEINGITDFDFFEKAYFEDGASFIGSPVKNNGAPLINAGMVIGITKKSQNHEIAWEFARRFIMDDYQNSFTMGQMSQTFPVKLSSFENLVSKAEKGKYSISTDFYDGRLRNTGALSKENAERLEGFLKSASGVSYADSRIKSIIYDETDRFLAEEQNAEETAENIKKKVKLYLDEIKK